MPNAKRAAKVVTLRCSRCRCKENGDARRSFDVLRGEETRPFCSECLRKELAARGYGNVIPFLVGVARIEEHYVLVNDVRSRSGDRAVSVEVLR